MNESADREGLTHLWEVPHPYYASEGNFYRQGNHYRFDSWADFKTDGIFDADRDLNLVYRWDWVKADPVDYEPGENLPGDMLQVFVMGQRKALCSSSFVSVTEADEPEVRAWLIECAKTITAIWAPLELTS